MAAPRKPAPSVEELALLISTANSSDLERRSYEAPTAQLPRAVLRVLYALGRIYRGDASHGIALLQAAVRPSLGRYYGLVADALLGILLARGDYSAAQRVTDALARLREPELSASLCAAESLLNRERGAVRQAISFLEKGIRARNAMSAPTLRLRAASRLALAAFWLSEYPTARALAAEAIMVAEEIGAHRIAAHAYSVLLAIAHYHLRDRALSYEYCDGLRRSAEAAGDPAYVRYALVADGWAAFEFGDIDRLRVNHRELLRRPLPEQQLEGFTASLLDGLVLALDEQFEACNKIMKEIELKRPGFTGGERSLLLSLQSICRFAVNEDDDARRLAREAISESSMRKAELDSVMGGGHDRINARLVGVGVCHYLGDLHRAKRSVPSRIDPDRTYLGALTPEGVKVDTTPQCFRGYAILLNTARAYRARNEPAAGLSSKEYELLIALLGGQSKPRIAAALGKSRFTVARQCESIYRKLGVRSRPELMLRAAELRIGPFARSQ